MPEQRMSLTADNMMFWTASSSSWAGCQLGLKVQAQARDEVSTRSTSARQRDSTCGSSAESLLEAAARRDGSSRVAAIAGGRAEAASWRRGRRWSSEWLRREDAMGMRARKPQGACGVRLCTAFRIALMRRCRDFRLCISCECCCCIHGEIRRSGSGSATLVGRFKAGEAFLRMSSTSS